jgi:hypothetical protein
MAGKKGNYSKVIIYDERRRYYYLWPQRNRPLLDDEIRDMGIGLLDQARRAVQRSWGDVAAPYNEYSAAAVSTENAFKVVQSSTTANNFTVTGGNAGGASLDHPATLYGKGFYVFLADDVEYNDQMYSSGSVDLNTESDKYKTLTSIPNLTTPGVERTDIVYAHLHFEEVTSVSGTDVDVYRDSGLKNPMVGTDTANRLRAVIDIRVYEGWDVEASPVDANIFTNPEFLGENSPNDYDPTDDGFKIPIAVIYRHPGEANIYTADIVDLLEMYDKRVKSLDELSWRIRHGGYTQADVDQMGYTGFTHRFPGAVVDEGAYATGLNQGLGTEAFNSDSVTPRVLDQTGKFQMGSLQVGRETGIVTYETGTEALADGEMVVSKASMDSLYVGYDMGVTGVREYRHNVSVYANGTSGTAGVDVTIEDGETGAYAVMVSSRETGMAGNYMVVDRLGRIGVNTMEPGWNEFDAPPGASGTEVAVDINASERVRQNLFVDNDINVSGNVRGRTWVVPAELTELNPAVFGWTGGQMGVTGAVACVLVKRGVAVVGESGIMGYGYTGIAGQYECYDLAGNRMFTIGDLGPEFDRTVMTLYGVGLREAYASDVSFLSLPGGYDYLQAGDTVTYDILREEGLHVTGAVTCAQNGWQAVEELRDDIIYNTGWGAPTGLYRQFVYTDTRGITGSIDDPLTTETGIGEAWGVQIIESIFGFTGAGYTGAIDDSHGKIIIKEMPEDPVNAEIRSIVSFTVSRTLLSDLAITFTPYHYYGSGGYGGDVEGFRFAKLDLGEGADAWLFNGDVFFNGVGGRNQVVFSPNVIMRDDLMVYGTLFADQLRFNFARVGRLWVDNDIYIGQNGEFEELLSVGDNSMTELKAMQGSNPNSDPRVKMYVKGGIRGTILAAESTSSDTNTVGDIYVRNTNPRAAMYARIGGTVGSTTNPLGLHLYDRRNTDTKANRFTFDYAGDVGDTGTDITVDVRGTLSASTSVIAPYMAVGNTTTTNADYPLYVAGRGLVEGELSVESLRFVGAEAPSGDTDIVTPVNVAIVDNATAQQTFHNNEIILREKNYTVTERIYLNNEGKLGFGVTGTRDYYEAMVAGTDGFYGHDTLTFTEPEIDTLAGTGNDVYVDQITDPGLKRYLFAHVNVCTLGTIRTTWIGYAFDPPSALDENNTIQAYEFESPYFRDRNGGSVISWMPGSRFGDDNFVVRVQGNLIDTHPDFPSMFTVDGCLAVYIPKGKWWGYGLAPVSSYRSFTLWYPYENVINSFNNLNMTQQTLCGGFVGAEWKVGLYPRLVKQTRLPFGTSAGSSQDRMYVGEWDLDVIVYPVSTGRCANMTGKLYISYVQT